MSKPYDGNWKPEPVPFTAMLPTITTALFVDGEMVQTPFWPEEGWPPTSQATPKGSGVDAERVEKGGESEELRY